jgi:ATP/maltotriose-dependent transcriptional regulator MalT
MAVSLGWFWLLTGSQEEATTAFRLAAAVPGDADPLDRVIVEAIARERTRADYEDMQSEMAELLDNLHDQGISERPLGVAVAPVLAMIAGQEERADRLFGEALAHPDPWVRAMVPFARAQIAENNGDVEGTRANLVAALEGFRGIGDRWALGLALMSWGTLRTLEGALADARAALEESYALLGQLNEGAEQMLLLLRLAEVHAREGDLEGARELCERSRRREAPGGEGEAVSLAALARLEARADPGRVPALREELAAVLAELGDHVGDRGHGRAVVHAALAALALAADDEEAARSQLEPAYRAAVESHDRPILANVGVTMASVLAAAGHPADAAETLGAAARLRGGEDPTALEIADLTAALQEELGAAGFSEAFARGRGLSPDAAVARLDPASALRPAAVRP